MTLTVQTIDAMLQAGCTAEQIAAVVKASLIADEEQAAARRAKEAARTARYRERGGGKIDPEVRAHVRQRDGDECQDCGATENLCLDHIIPVSKGGHSDADNLQVLCIPCNSRKRDRIRKRDERKLSELSKDIPRDIADTPPPKGGNLEHSDLGSSPPPIVPPQPSKPKAHRLPEDFAPDADLIAWVEREFPHFDWRTNHDIFVDYWRSSGAPSARKLDWRAAWRIWMRKDATRTGTSPYRSSHAARMDGIARSNAERVDRALARRASDEAHDGSGTPRLRLIASGSRQPDG